MKILFVQFGSGAPEVPAIVLSAGAPETAATGEVAYVSADMLEDADDYDAAVVPYLVGGEETGAFLTWGLLKTRWEENGRKGAMPVLLPYGQWPKECEVDDAWAAFEIAEQAVSSILMRPRVLPPVLPRPTVEMCRRIIESRCVAGMPFFQITGQRLYAMLDCLLNDPDQDRDTYAANWHTIGGRFRLSPYDALPTIGRLLDDLVRFHGGGPDPETLENAPTLYNWRQVPRTEYALEGGLADHPLLGDRRYARTSIIFRMDPEAGWARTLNRLYRLRHPAPGNDDDIPRH